MTQTAARIAYDAADAAQRAAFPAFQQALQDYRAKRIDDAAFIAARLAYNALLGACDAAEAALREAA